MSNLVIKWVSERVSEEKKNRCIEERRSEKLTYKGGFAGTTFTPAAATFYNMAILLYYCITVSWLSQN